MIITCENNGTREWKQKSFWFKAVGDTLIKMGAWGISAGVYKKVGNVWSGIRKDLGEWIQDPFYRHNELFFLGSDMYLEISMYAGNSSIWSDF